MPRLLIPVFLAIWMCLESAWCQTTARQAGYLYLSPVPQASFVSAQTRYILMRFVDVSPSAITNLGSVITVSGADSGPHTGATRVASDGRTVIFEMSTDFSSNELVSVSLTPLVQTNIAGHLGPFGYQFMTTAPMPDTLPLISVGNRTAVRTPSAAEAKPVRPKPNVLTRKTTVRKAMTMPNGVSVPSDFPQVSITVNSNASPGYLFLENALNGVPPYTMMLDNDGLPVWYRQGRMFDFKIQKNGMITWCQEDDAGLATFSAFDQNFNYLRSYATTNGYLTDGHDLKILPDGRYFIIGYRVNLVDLSQFIIDGAPVDVIETVVQGFTAKDELIFQWRAWDNYDIRDLVPEGNSDFPHMNGLDIDEDGNVLVSARHLSEVTKINAHSGDIIWRLGGAHSSFTFPNDPLNGTSYQHNISALGDDRYMVFDNGDYHFPVVSRAVEYVVDPIKMEAIMTWQFRDKPDKYTYWMGSAQRLPTGNTLIDFVSAQYPKAIEVDSSGVKHFELSLVPSADSYRAFRFPWNGVVASPYLIVEPQQNNVTLIFNKFGDTNVGSYRIYGGTSPHPTAVVAESNITLKQLTGLPTGSYYLRVTAVSADGSESPFSNEASLILSRPGQDLVQNGDFSQDQSAWNFRVDSSANASWSIENGVSKFNITNGGTSLGAVQLFQTNLPIILGDLYALAFDAWSEQSQFIQATLAQSVSPFLDYSGLAPTYVTPNRTRYHYLFTMIHPSDPQATLQFNMGSYSGSVYLANIVLFNPAVGDLNLDGRVDIQDLRTFCQSWLKKQTGLPADLNQNGTVDFNDFSLLGQNWDLGTH